MNSLSGIFITLLLLAAALRAWLALRQIRHVRRHRETVPAAFAEEITASAHRKAADYAVARTRLGLGSLALDLALALLWTFGGGLTVLDDLVRQLGLGRLTTGVLAIAGFVLVNALVALPLSAYSTFGIEADFGFNRTTLKTFALDIVKVTGLAVVLGTPLLYAALALMYGTGAHWWLWVWALWFGFSLLLTWAYPAFIAPFFNRFTPLADETLKARIESLLERCGFSSRGVFVMDGSARSAHGNAYFTGFGRNKRIVFFDTLMDKLAAAEIEAVLAHELGHFRLKHVQQRLVLTALLGFLGMALLAWLASHVWFYEGLYVPAPSAHMALLLFSLLLPPGLFLLEPLASAWSRLHEFQADAYACRQADGNALIHSLVKLCRDNATTLTPDPLHSAFYDSHPPPAVRIARLQSLVSQAD